MKYEDFEKFIKEKCMYDTIYEDSDGRQILIIQMLDAYGMVDKALRARLAQPEQEQEPVAYLCENAVGHKYFRWKKPSSEYKPIALYAAHASPQRIWQGLTEEERLEILGVGGEAAVLYVTEAKLREKNT